MASFKSSGCKSVRRRLGEAKFFLGKSLDIKRQEHTMQMSQQRGIKACGQVWTQC